MFGRPRELGTKYKPRKRSGIILWEGRMLKRIWGQKIETDELVFAEEGEGAGIRVIWARIRKRI
jgi:hypothetical protein